MKTWLEWLEWTDPVGAVALRMSRVIRRRLSAVSLAEGTVRVRNFPGRTKAFPVARVERFDWRDVLDVQPEVRQVAVVVLKDDTEYEVHALDPDHPGRVPELNNRLLGR